MRKKMRKNTKNVFLVLLMLALPNILLGAGLDSANTLMESIRIALHGIAIVTVTVCIMWVAYGLIWGGKRIQDFGMVIVGAIIIASASEIANMMFT